MITAQELRDMGACEHTVSKLEAEWPEGAEITLPTCIRAAELRADFYWLASRLLHGQFWHCYKVLDDVLVDQLLGLLEAECEPGLKEELQGAYYSATASAFYLFWKNQELSDEWRPV